MRDEGEVEGEETTAAAFGDGQDRVIRIVLVWVGGGLIIGPLCCVRILRLRTFPDCVRRANSRGLYAENAGTQERTQTATQSAPVGHVTQTQKTCGQITGEGLSKGLAPMNVTVQNSRTLMVQLNLRCKEESAELVVWFVSRHFPR